MNADSAAHSILLSHPLQNSFVTRCSMFLQTLELPDIFTLICRPPSRLGWKRFIHSVLHDLMISGLEDAVPTSPRLYDLFYAQEILSDGRPARILYSCLGDVCMSRLINNRIRLLIHCSDLASDTGVFSGLL